MTGTPVLTPRQVNAALVGNETEETERLPHMKPAIRATAEPHLQTNTAPATKQTRSVDVDQAMSVEFEHLTSVDPDFPPRGDAEPPTLVNAPVRSAVDAEPGVAPIRIVAIGNPGVGKSTFLNCLLGEPAFKSGLSFGAGLTTTSAVVKRDDVEYIDTPGLCDVKMEKRAAEEITRVLQSGGRLKLFFFVRLQAGRVVADDLVTLTRVLDSLRGDLNSKFTIVVNNLLPAMYAKLQPRDEEFQLIMECFRKAKYHTSSVILNPFNNQLDEMDDAVSVLPQEVLTGVEQAGVVELSAEAVGVIDTSDYRAEAQALRDLLERERARMAQERAAHGASSDPKRIDPSTPADSEPERPPDEAVVLYPQDGCRKPAGGAVHPGKAKKHKADQPKCSIQ